MVAGRANLTKQWSRRGETLAPSSGVISPRGSLLSLGCQMTARIVIALVAVGLAASVSGADSYQHFLGELKLAEGLPPGYHWSATRGRDFDLFHASAADGRGGVNVYLGYHGQLSPRLLSQKAEPGNFAGIPVRWYRTEQESGEQLRVLAFVEHYAHLSCYEKISIQPTVVAEDEEILQRLLRSLSQVKIIGPTCSEPNKRFEATRGNPLAPQAGRWAARG